MQILVAEDDVTSRTILTAVLRKWGYDPIAAPDGAAAWRIMQKTNSPVLAILDWEMPGMDGVEVCRRIRQIRASNPPYLIILTARGEKADIVEGLDAGANDYVAKPYDNDELRARIEVGRRMVELQTQLLEAKELIAHEAMHDPLTGALNRKAILDGLDKEMKRSKRRNSKLSIGLCDLDHFKSVNDTYGHQVGDEVLCRFVREIQSDLRGYDLLGRYGGEEFLIVAPDSNGSFEEGLYERLRLRTAGCRMKSKSTEFGVTVSIGVAGLGDGENVGEILAAADAALYRAKDEGRNRVVYASDMSEKTIRRMAAP